MKKINNNFFNIVAAFLIAMSLLLNITFSNTDIPGKKIKKQKTYKKEQIKKNILNTITKIESLPIHYNNNPSNPIIENLSQSAQERYKLENNYTFGNIAVNNTIILPSQKKSFFALPFIQKNYAFINNYLTVNNIEMGNISYYFTLLLLYKNLITGNKLKESLNKAIFQIKKSPPINGNGIISLLCNNKKYPDDQMIENINNIILYNGSNPIEIDRAINRLYNNAKRKPVLLIIDQYDKNNFTIKENNNTYGELAPSKDIYQKIINDKTKLEDQKMRDRFQLLRRNISIYPPIQTKYFLAIPKIKSNIVEYMTLEKNRDEEIEIKKIETIINNLNKDYFYSLSIITD